VVPVLLLAGAAALLGRKGTARRGGLAVLVWSLLVAGVLVATGLGQDWARAADVARVVTALAVGALGVPVLLLAASLRAQPARPAPAPRAGCAGCACGAGGCGAG
jgi:peptidoglycan/LPS O-acetylase OafA/YrhL